MSIMARHNYHHYPQYRPIPSLRPRPSIAKSSQSMSRNNAWSEQRSAAQCYQGGADWARQCHHDSTTIAAVKADSLAPCTGTPRCFETSVFHRTRAECLIFCKVYMWIPVFGVSSWNEWSTNASNAINVPQPQLNVTCDASLSTTKAISMANPHS